MPVNATKCTKIDESQASQQVISLSPGWVSIGEAWMKQAEMDGRFGKGSLKNKITFSRVLKCSSI